MGDYNLYRGRGAREALRGPDGIATALLFKRQHPEYKQLTFLLVEGDTDRHLYESLMDEKSCSVQSTGLKPSARSTALAVQAILEQKGVTGVLAIVDADFDILEGREHASPNVFLTDAHDVELMVVQSPALEKVLREFGSESKIEKTQKNTGKDIRTLLLLTFKLKQPQQSPHRDC